MPIKKPLIFAIIPARSGSRGLKDKNIRKLAGKPMMAYSIEFAQKLNVDKIICSTDSKEYADIARKFGAEVPFLRSSNAASNTAMEEDILADLYNKFTINGILQPDIIVWLRPTFVFRNLKDVQKCIDILKQDKSISSARTVCETEARLYSVENNMLKPEFNDGGKSMIRRQDIGTKYKVYSTDVFRADKMNVSDSFLGNKVAAVVTNKLCGLDIDDEVDFEIIESILLNGKDLINVYT